MSSDPQVPWYQKARRRILVDMHIGDWDPQLLAKYSPKTMVENYKRAGVEYVMFYCQSHVGLCNWPTKSGKQHANLVGRDVVGEMVELLKGAGMASCAYYSTIFNNWAYGEHPEWRMSPGMERRYGLCCPNNEGYRQFCRQQLQELVGGYRFDGLYIDMTFWPYVCQCPSCRERYRQEHGSDIPQTINWFDKAWCTYQAARERWMDDFEHVITTHAKSIQPDIAVYHNFACAFNAWNSGVTFETAKNHDFLGGDFYGDPIEQVMAGKLLRNLTPNQPPEFQTSRCHTLGDHERTKSAARLQAQAVGTLMYGGAFMMIDAINPDGTINPAVYDRMRQANDLYARYQPFIGGQVVEDIAIYFSGESKMDFSNNGKPIAQPPYGPFPHIQAVRGFCRILTQAHLPFGVITRQRLKDLGRYKVVILPNILRMSRQEADAFRQYVAGGGRIYASRYTSLVETAGVLHKDFMLADVFGCRFGGLDAGRVAYFKMLRPELQECISPQRYLSHFPPPQPYEHDCLCLGTLALAGLTGGAAIANVVQPYSQTWGNANEREWVSIHSSPPWRETDTPGIVENTFGSGRCVYCAADIETVESEGNDRLLVHLVRSLAEGTLSFGAETYPAIQMSVFHQADRKRLLVCILNGQAMLPPVPAETVNFRVLLPKGVASAKVTSLPGGEPVESRVENGSVFAAARHVDLFAMLAVDY
jgi:hypothetical protein